MTVAPFDAGHVMSNQSPTASSKDQFPHSDVANNEEGGTTDNEEGRRDSANKNEPNPTQSRRTPGSAEGERDRNEQSR
jgi:hypothetical protein